MENIIEVLTDFRNCLFKNPIITNPHPMHFAIMVKSKYPEAVLYKHNSKDDIVIGYNRVYFNLGEFYRKLPDNYSLLEESSSEDIISLFSNAMERTFREGRGSAKGECIEVLEKSRLELKETISITYLQDKIREEV